MFGYVLPSRDRLDERERERFRAVYCGLCHTLRERYGFAASLPAQLRFHPLAILLSSGDEESCTVRRCAVHPCKGCRAQTSTPALEAAADRTVILSWWQLRDHIADHGFGAGSNTALLRSFCAVLTAGQGSGCRTSTRRCGCISKRSRRWRMRAAPPLIWRQSPSRR